MLAIMGAIEAEVASLRARLTNRVDETHFGLEIHRGELDSVPILLTRSGVGKVNAAQATLALISAGATSLIFTGIAGAVNPELNVGDIVVATDLVHHDADATGVGEVLGQIPGEDFAFATDPTMTERLYQAAKAISDTKVVTGRIVSGDQFIASDEKVAQLAEIFDAQCVEMEGAALAQVCNRLKLPFAVVRIMSDTADHNAGTDYSTFVIEVASRGVALILGYLGRLMREIR